MPSFDVDAPDLPVTPYVDDATVRSPGVLRIEPVNGPRFLEILVEPVEDRPVLAGGEVVQIENAVEPHAADERHESSVR